MIFIRHYGDSECDGESLNRRLGVFLIAFIVIECLSIWGFFFYVLWKIIIEDTNL